MSNQPTDPQAADESLEDVEVPANEADAVTGGTYFKAASEDGADDNEDNITT